jgi:flagellar basal-body rod modification protein FlgD
MTVSNIANSTSPSTASNATSASTASAAAAASVSALSVNDFLTLMTAQLQDQDPTQPLDPSTFVSQLAQFGTVEGVDSMQSSLSTLSSTLLANQALNSVNLVGHSVMTAASSAQYTAGQSMTGAVQVPSGASAVVVDVTDSAGAVVQQIAVSANSGLNSFTWDGSTQGGSQAASGSYGFQAIGAVGGANQALQTYLSGTVSSVTLGSSGSGVTVNTPQLGSVALSNVESVD